MPTFGGTQSKSCEFFITDYHRLTCVMYQVLSHESGLKIKKHNTNINSDAWENYSCFGILDCV